MCITAGPSLGSSGGRTFSSMSNNLTGARILLVFGKLINIGKVCNISPIRFCNNEIHLGPIYHVNVRNSHRVVKTFLKVNKSSSKRVLVTISNRPSRVNHFVV